MSGEDSQSNFAHADALLHERPIPLQPCKKNNPGHNETAGGHTTQLTLGRLELGWSGKRLW